MPLCKRTLVRLPYQSYSPIQMANSLEENFNLNRERCALFPYSRLSPKNQLDIYCEFYSVGNTDWVYSFVKLKN